MSQYQFELATLADDADLCNVLAATPTDGRIAISFRRDPSWFAGSAVDGRLRQVVACRDVGSGRVVGFGCRSVREVYVNGQPAEVGYLSSLRLLPGHRNRGLVARGFGFFRDLHGDRRVPYYLTTIASGNRTALDLLTSGRAGLPQYHPAGTYHTVAIPLARRAIGGQLPTVRIRPATLGDLPAVLTFLAGEGPRRQFFPRLGVEDFQSRLGAMRGLALDWLLLAESEGRLVGTLAGWDQHGDRRSVVHAYRGWLRCARPFYNVWASVRGRYGLPRPGGDLRYLTVALPIVVGEEESVFAALLTHLRAKAAGGPWSHLVLGLHETDPLLPVARQWQATCYVTHFFIVCWPDGETARAALDGRGPYLEAGSL